MKKLKIGAILLICIMFISACSCSKEKFEVTFDSNGGPSIEKVTVFKGERVNKPIDPVREGYVFGGWFIKLDDSNSYDFSKEVTSNLNLIAKWIKLSNILTITFDSNGGSDVTTMTINEGSEITLPTPTRSGYNFLGWYNGETKVDSTKELSDNTILTARWEAIQRQSTIAPTYRPTTQTQTTPKEETPAPVVDTYKCIIENVTGSTVGQVRIFATKNGEKINGTCIITTNSGSVITKSVDTSGYLTNSGIISSVVYKEA